MYQTLHNDRLVNKIGTIEMKCDGMMHDAACDYFGNKLATGSSDGYIHIYDLESHKTQVSGQSSQRSFSAHQGPVWQLSWSNPKYGNLLASCSFDKTVKIWKEEGNLWKEVLEKPLALKESANCVAWAKAKLILAVGSADGLVTVFVMKDQGQQLKMEGISNQSHKLSVNAVNWMKSEDDFVLASGSCDETVLIWKFDQNMRELSILKCLEFKCGAIRSLDWAAECFDDEVLLAVGFQSNLAMVIEFNEAWREKQRLEIKVPGPSWRVQWSPLGNQLAISTLNDQGGNEVKVYMQTDKNKFEQI